MVKTAIDRQLRRAGHARHLQLQVTNTGNVTLTAVGVTDPMVGLSARSAARRHPGPGGHRDLHRHLHHHPGRRGRRPITNTGTATGTPPTGPPVTAHLDGHRARPARPPRSAS